ncbi:hypothetical protein [Kitasatospora sp. LaBMicrA B282]|uniref:hypothetical protein n=1 Tax=Kitasatospora sp. LaBMicrA B282 TaxID=3420949 RepID=UPI003D111E89
MTSGSAGLSATPDIPPQLVFDAVEAVLSVVAVEELPLLDGLRTLDEDQLRRRLARPGEREDPLGFGLGEVVALLTPLVWEAVQKAAKQAAGKAVEQATTSLLARLRTRLRRGRQPGATLPTFSPEQLTAVHERVEAAARDGGLDDDRARLFADCVIGRLALPPGEH